MTVKEVIEKSRQFELFHMPGTGELLFAEIGSDGRETGFVACAFFDANNRETLESGKADLVLKAGPFEADPTVRYAANGSPLA